MTGRGSVLVVGAGRSGVAAAALAVHRGHRVVLWEERGEPPADARWHTGRGLLTEAAVRGADRVVVSPGIDVARHPVLGPAAARGVPVVGEVGFAAEGWDRPLIGITGTNGKSTVTSFTGALLAASLPGRTFVGGNLGSPLSEAVLDGGFDRAVVELSSYQLERPGPLRPAVSVILNLTPDHLERHGTMDDYARAKWRIATNLQPKDLVLLPAEHPRLHRTDPGRGRRACLGAHPGVVRTGRSVRIVLEGLDVTLDLSDVSLPGAHNLDHAATAATLALALGAPVDGVQAALGSLVALPHRMQPVHVDARGVQWIDDSKATNVEATSVAVSGLDRPAVVLLGGQAKAPDGAGFDGLVEALARHRAVVTFGASGPEIAGALRRAGLSTVVESDGLRDAVVAAMQRVQPGDAVLLSPGCASFDAFHDFEHRGRAFAAWARGQEAT